MIAAQDIFSIQNDQEFEQVALEVFRFQAVHNPIYNQFLAYLKVDYRLIKSLDKIPFMPIKFFKQFDVVTGEIQPQKIFTSSGTTGMQVSRHLVTDLNLYHESLHQCFRHFYGELKDYNIFALLPSYLERDGSSLIDMVEYWIEHSRSGGFYLYNHQELLQDLLEADQKGQKSILIGVSFALIDFVEQHQIQLNNTIVMETGGMKGRKKELTRSELHQILQAGFGVSEIHSEYGMTELLSQAYAVGGSRFRTPNWMRVLLRDTEDPLSIQLQARTGGVNIIDLANINSCSFIATDDLGKIDADGSFEILGRFDHSDVRGCNLMVV